MKTIRDFLRKHALLLLAALVVVSVPVGGALGKYVASETVTDGLNLNVSMKTYTLMTGARFNSILGTKCPSMSRIVFCNASDIASIANAEYKCELQDTSIKDNGIIKLYYDSTTGTAYIAPENDGTIYANANCYGMFYADINDSSKIYRNLKEIVFTNFNTSKVTNMERMFAYHVSIQPASSLKQLDLSGFDTSSVVNMRNMFGGSLNLLDLI